MAYKPIVQLMQSDRNYSEIIINSTVASFLFVTIVFCYLFSPNRYSVNEHELVIHRPASDKKILLKSISNIRHIKNNERGVMIRTFGVGGLFGNFGQFYSRKLGRFTLFGTQNKNYVLFETNGKKFMLTPDDLGILEDLQKRI